MKGTLMVKRISHPLSLTSIFALTSTVSLFPNTATALGMGGGSGTGVADYVMMAMCFLALLVAAIQKKVIDATEAALIVGLILFFVFAYFYDNNLLQS